MKLDLFKLQLFTNISHEIKTPAYFDHQSFDKNFKIDLYKSRNKREPAVS